MEYKTGKNRTRSEAFSSSSTEDSFELKKVKLSTSIADTSIEEMSNAELLEELDKKLKIQEMAIVDKISTKFDTILERLNDRIHKAEKKTEELQNKVSLFQVKLNEKETENAELRAEIMQCRRNTIRTEQYSRRNNLKILGLDEKQKEKNEEQVINFVRSELSYHIDEKDVVSAHRIKGKSEKTP